MLPGHGSVLMKRGGRGEEGGGGGRDGGQERWMREGGRRDEKSMGLRCIRGEQKRRGEQQNGVTQRGSALGLGSRMLLQGCVARPSLLGSVRLRRLSGVAW